MKAESGLFQETEPSRVKAELIPERLWMEPGKLFNLWLRLTIEPGWHIYWKNPGESGLPTTVSWSLPPGVSLLELSWAVPEKFVDSLATSYGYKDQVLILATLSISPEVPAGSALRLDAEISYLVCREGCLPGSCSSSLALEVKKAAAPENKAYRHVFFAARLKLPEAARWPTSAEADQEAVRIFFQPPAEQDLDLLGASFFIENEGIIDYGSAEKWEKAASRYVLSLKRAPVSTELPAVIKGVLVLNRGSNQGNIKAFSLEVPLKEIKRL